LVENPTAFVSRFPGRKVSAEKSWWGVLSFTHLKPVDQCILRHHGSVQLVRRPPARPLRRHLRLKPRHQRVLVARRRLLRLGAATLHLGWG
jgi:hypothetical protein